MRNPELLFRGSPRKDASLFVPKERVGSGSSERLVVSASPDRSVATKFVVPIENLNVTVGSFGEIQYYVCDNEQSFRETDKGGGIYTLRRDGFEFNSGVGVWTSLRPVEPISKEEVTSGLNAMIDAGIQVFFVDPETFKRIKESSDNGLEILRNAISENMKQNKNVKFLPNSLS